MTKHTAAVTSCVAIAYLRASKREQRLSPAAQRAAIAEWATRERVHIAVWCSDQGVPSITPVERRPALCEALHAVRQHRAALFVVAKRDRIARDVVLAVSIERAVSLAGARLVSASGEGNGDTPADAFIRLVIDGAAQYEHGLIRARTRAALEAKRVRRERVGSIPYGFTLAADRVHLVRDKHEQATILRARRMRRRGLSFRVIAARLAAEGCVNRKGRPFFAAQVARMLAQQDVP